MLNDTGPVEFERVVVRSMKPQSTQEDLIAKEGGRMRFGMVRLSQKLNGVRPLGQS